MTNTSTKFDYIISFGCSLAWGAELVNRDRRYAQLIANKYRAILLDYSVAGNSNENISQTVINVLLSIKEKIPPERILVLVGWTYCSRLNYSGKNNKYYVIAEYNLDSHRRKTKLARGHKHIYFNDDFDDPMDLMMFYKHHTNLTYMFYNMTRNIHHAQMFLKNNGYNYVFSFASDLEMNLVTSPQEIYDNLGIKGLLDNCSYPNFKHLINDIDMSFICSTAFANFASRHKFQHGPEHHPLEKGHEAYANILIDFIESKYGKQILHGPQSGIS